MDIDDIRHANLQLLIAAAGSQQLFSERVGIKNPSQVSQWVTRAPNSRTGKPRGVGTASARSIEKAWPLKRGWMDVPHASLDDVSYYGKDANHSRYEVREATPDSEALPIELTSARGSCGGGSTFDAAPRLPLLKEPSWFRRYKLAPENALAVWADGDSMAEFIVDGDIVIFDTSKRTPVSGLIHLIDHPDGLRIKVLRRNIDGSWTLESKNPDKRRYPDERVGAEHVEHIKVIGTFVYRQGG